MGVSIFMKASNLRAGDMIIWRRESVSEIIGIGGTWLIRSAQKVGDDQDLSTIYVKVNYINSEGNVKTQLLSTNLLKTFALKIISDGILRENER